jgi:type IX secretion system PorP/SprF family membrane protein
MNCKRFLNSEYMKNFKYIFLLIAICVVQKSTAQQDPNFTLYNFNMNVINPAFAGSTGVKQINLGYRSQWIGVSDAPNTQVINYTTPLKHGLGLGVSLVRDQVFVLQETDLTVDFSYKLQLSETHDLFFGVKTGASIVNIDLNKAGASENDPLFNSNQSFTNAQFGAGAYLRHQNYYVSISSPNFLTGKRYIKQGNAPKAAVDNLHMYYGAGYHFKINENVKITSAFMHRSTEGTPSSTDINATVDYNNIQAGMNYRVDEMYSIFTLFNIMDNVRFGAAYDFTTSKINQVNNNGSIEMLIRYQF